MNNWRLLLLALVAVFQPITSFTERNLIDGRQQCCDRQTDTLLRDSRPYLYESKVLAKPSLPVRRLNVRDVSREDRQLSQRVALFSRRSTERLDIREKDIRKNPSIATQSTRVEYLTRRIVSDDNGERQLDGVPRERRTLTRVAIMKRNVRINQLSSRYSHYRDENQINRLNDRRDRDISRQSRIQSMSENHRRLTPTRAARDRLWMKREDVDRVRVSHEGHRLVERERVNVILREPMSRDVRRSLDSNHERRDQERRTERRSLSENSIIVQRVRGMNIRVNARDQNQETRENRQQNNDRREYRKTVRENAEVRNSGERMQLERSDMRNTRFMNVRDRVVENRDTRQTERLSRETSDEQMIVRERRVEMRESRRTSEGYDRVTNQRARSVDLRTFHDTRSELKMNRFIDSVRKTDATRRHITHRHRIANQERDTVDRTRNIESIRARDNTIMINKLDVENEPIHNWQYIFYSVQAAYLCGLIIQMLTPIQPEKSKTKNLHWWSSASERLIKVD